ncbi:hypothetical protein H4Q26_004225 [Puccinia striiformis f. sp. tritici PST-130]|nr:hypothetical protein H4Q26_004225 [Puccinia striiformis f. sp. tritici PST-130]
MMSVSRIELGGRVSAILAARIERFESENMDKIPWMNQLFAGISHRAKLIEVPKTKSADGRVIKANPIPHEEDGAKSMEGEDSQAKSLAATQDILLQLLTYVDDLLNLDNNTL